MTWLAPSFTASLCAALALAQVPDPWGEIRGEVRADDGTPVAGARVRIEARFGAQGAFTTAAEALLRRHRLPAAKANRDGSYVLAVLPDHREVSATGLEWWLICEADGYQAWRERLPRGLHGYLGSTVTLQRPDPADDVTLIANGADVAAGVVLHRRLGETLVVRFDSDGRARIGLPKLPSPLQPNMVASAYLDWHVGTPRGPRLRRPEHFLIAEARESAPVVVTRRDGQIPAGVRALLWNGVEASLGPLREGHAPYGTTVLAVLADGCRMGATAPLEPRPDLPRRSIRILDERGVAVPQARGLLLACTEWRPPSTRQPGARLSERSLWREAHAADANGVLELGDPPADAPAVLLLAADGYDSVDVLDPHGIAGDAVVRLRARPVGAAQVTVLDPDGRPIEGARVCLADAACCQASIHGEDLLTDAQGRVQVEGLLPGHHPLFVLRRGFASRVLLLTGVVAGETRRLAVGLQKCESGAWIVRAEHDRRPVPFARLLGTPGGEAGGSVTDTANPWPGLNADASGRLVLPHAPAPRFFASGGVSSELDVESVARRFGSILLPAPRPVLVVAGDGLALATVFCRAPGGRVCNTQSGAGAGVVLFPARGEFCSAQLAPGGEVTLWAADLEALPPDPRTGLRTWVVDLPRVQVVIPEGCASPELWQGRRARDGRLMLAPTEVVVFRDTAGRWRLCDPEASELWFLHPKHAPVRCSLTAAQRRGDEPITFAVAPASPLTVDPTRGGIAVSNVRIEVLAKNGTQPKLVFEASLLLAPDAQDPGTGAPRCPIELPALPAGDWVVTVQAQLITLHNRANRGVTFTRTVRTDGRTRVDLTPDGR